MQDKLVQGAVVITALLTGATAMAATPFGDHVTLTGFGTLGATSANTDAAQYRAELSQARGAGHGVDVGVDSKLGLQANARFNDIFSAVGQLFVSRRISDQAALEWFYGQANLPAGFDIKLGRFVLPTFMISDSRNVGYAAHWLRAPQEVYALYPAPSLDGGQLAYRRSFGAINLTVQASTGKAKSDVLLGPFPATLNFNRLRSLNVLAETGDWLFRVGQTTAELSFTGVRLPQSRDTFSGIGLQYDNGKAIVIGEYVTRRDDGIGIFDSDSWYVSGGWHFGDWTPYVIASQFKPKGISYSDRTTGHTESLGLRWNFMPNVDLKVQVERTRGTHLSFVNAQSPAFYVMNPPSVRVLSVALDFVF